MTELPEEDFVKHPDGVLRRVRAGEEITVTAEGEPVMELRRRRRPRGMPRVDVPGLEVIPV